MKRHSGFLITLLVALGLVLSLGSLGLLDSVRLARGAGNISIFVSGLFPPNPTVLPTVSAAILETLQIAFVGTLLGFVFALPLSLLATPGLTGRSFARSLRLLLAAIRTVPSLLWAIVFVVAVGLGPAAGALGLAVYTIGYLGKILPELFEGIDPEVIEAIRGLGSNRLQLARFAYLPEAGNAILAQLLFMFEYNVRASSILGFVGAGGIGFYLLGYIELLRYDSVLTALLVTLVVVVAIDWLSSQLRRRLLQ